MARRHRLSITVLSLWLGSVAWSVPKAAGPQTPGPGPATAAAAERDVLDRYCVGCHNDRLKTSGLSLEKLRELVEAEDARAALRREWHSGVEDPVRRRQILEQALTLIGRQLELVRRRRDEIAALEGELAAKRRRIRSRLRELAEHGAERSSA